MVAENGFRCGVHRLLCIVACYATRRKRGRKGSSIVSGGVAGLAVALAGVALAVAVAVAVAGLAVALAVVSGGGFHCFPLVAVVSGGSGGVAVSGGSGVFHAGNHAFHKGIQ